MLTAVAASPRNSRAEVARTWANVVAAQLLHFPGMMSRTALTYKLKTTNPVSKLFFDYNHQKDESTCTVQGCRKPLMKGRHSHNLETHIR
ncbi:hypothetical protein ACI65C_006434 [Semiaphis heraclei]